MLKVSEEAIEFAHKNDVPVMYVTEDTTRSRPETLERLYGMAIDHDVERLVHLRHCGPRDSRARKRSCASCAAWWKNRARTSASTGTATATATSAWPTPLRRTMAGADRVHGSMLGIGERVGNTTIDMLMVNFKLMGLFDRDLTKLPAYARRVVEVLPRAAAGQLSGARAAMRSARRPACTRMPS